MHQGKPTVMIEIMEEELDQLVALLQNKIVARRIKTSPLRRIADVLTDACIQVKIDPQDRIYEL